VRWFSVSSSTGSRLSDACVARRKLECPLARLCSYEAAPQSPSPA
jgi:hypothetical protein